MTRASRRSELVLPPPSNAGLIPVHVYRVELVEERVLCLPADRASSAPVAADVLWHYLRGADREHFVVMLLDPACNLLGLNTVATGDLSETVVGVREVLKPALLRQAEKLVVGHNHIHAGPSPSRSDKALTRTLDRACKAVGILLVDHVIVTRDRGYFSFAEEGLL